jgi:flagellar protein FliO/FliZ
LDNATLTGAGAGLGLASVKMAAALLLILGLIFLALALMKRYGLAARLQGRTSGALRVEERVALGPRKQLVVVRFLNKLLVLGVTDSGINLIAEHQADNEPTPDFQTTLDQEARENPPS